LSDADTMKTQSAADQEPQPTDPPSQDTLPGGTTAPDDADVRDGGEDIKDKANRSTAFDKAQGE